MEDIWHPSVQYAALRAKETVEGPQDTIATAFPVLLEDLVGEVPVRRA